VRFCRKEQAAYYFKAAAVFSEAWEAEYRTCLDGRAASRIEVAVVRTIPASITIWRRAICTRMATAGTCDPAQLWTHYRKFPGEVWQGTG